MTMEKIKKELEHVFTSDGCLEGKGSTEKDNSILPVKLSKCRVPVAMMTLLKEELNDLERGGIIAPVEHSTDWVRSMVSVTKQNRKSRIWTDPKTLNQALKN